MELAGIEPTGMGTMGTEPAGVETPGMQPASMMHAIHDGRLGLRGAGSERVSTCFWASRAQWQNGERWGK